MATTQEWLDATQRMLRDPDTWPRWPVLPLKNPQQITPEDPFGKLGVLIDPLSLREDKLVIYLTDMFFVKVPGRLSDVPTEEYESVASCTDAGWRVD